jgi:hypothetical protein
MSFLYYLQSDEATTLDLLGIEGTLSEAASTIIGETGGLVPLRQPAANGFRVDLHVSDLNGVASYGIAYRVQSLESYMLFSINPANQTWQIAQVEQGVTQPLESGIIKPPQPDPTHIAVSGVDPYYRLEIGEQRIQREMVVGTGGGVGIWFDIADDVSPPIEQVQTAFVDEDAESAYMNRPLLATPLFRLQNTVLKDTQSLLATGDPRGKVDCPSYIPIYEAMERHAEHEETKELARQVVDASRLIYNTCTVDNPNGQINLNITDYNRWRTELGEVIANLEVN